MIDLPQHGELQRRAGIFEHVDLHGTAGRALACRIRLHAVVVSFQGEDFKAVRKIHLPILCRMPDVSAKKIGRGEGWRIHGERPDPPSAPTEGGLRANCAEPARIRAWSCAGPTARMASHGSVRSLIDFERGGGIETLAAKPPAPLRRGSFGQPWQGLPRNLGLAKALGEVRDARKLAHSTRQP
jgi:hypothetical protein